MGDHRPKSLAVARSRDYYCESCNHAERKHRSGHLECRMAGCGCAGLSVRSTRPEDQPRALRACREAGIAPRTRAGRAFMSAHRAASRAARVVRVTDTDAERLARLLEKPVFSLTPDEMQFMRSHVSDRRTRQIVESLLTLSNGRLT